MEKLRMKLRTELDRARSRTDELFALIQPEAIYERPIPERHRIIFYLGHIETFDWTMICRTAHGMDSFNEAYARLFAFGIDPIDGQLPDDRPSDWPSVDMIRDYNRRVRSAVDACLNTADFNNGRQPYIEKGLIYWAAIEHRLMHAETLGYMMHWMPPHLKKGRISNADPDSSAPPPRMSEIPEGITTLGIPEGNGAFGWDFGWDNEFSAHSVQVPAFSIDVYNVTNGQYLDFIRAEGYSDSRLWTLEAWDWIRSSDIRHPKFWSRRKDAWFYQTMFGEVPLPLSWPVYVSHAEATAYAKWAGKTLPSEAQLHRAAFGSIAGSERPYPWGDSEPQPARGNFDFRSWTPAPVGSHPAGNSAFGVADMTGNGWEWTSTVFEPFPGFERFPFYPGYSMDFFDGKHYVMKGGSPRTAARLLRRSFRNWFQPHYPNIYATFRCVEN